MTFLIGAHVRALRVSINPSGELYKHIQKLQNKNAFAQRGTTVLNTAMMTEVNLSAAATVSGRAAQRRAKQYVFKSYASALSLSFK
jgi:hypothetical protein